MAKQIIIQPDGKYCIFSSIVDNITDANMTEDELIEEFRFNYGNIGVERVTKIISELKEGKKPYNQFTIDFNKMLDTIAICHGDEEKQEVLNKINSTSDEIEL